MLGLFGIESTKSTENDEPEVDLPSVFDLSIFCITLAVLRFSNDPVYDSM